MLNNILHHRSHFCSVLLIKATLLLSSSKKKIFFFEDALCFFSLLILHLYIEILQKKSNYVAQSDHSNARLYETTKKTLVASFLFAHTLFFCDNILKLILKTVFWLLCSSFYTGNIIQLLLQFEAKSLYALLSAIISYNLILIKTKRASMSNRICKSIF